VLRSDRLAALLIFASLFLPPAPAPAQTPAPPRVARFSPEGVVKGVRQVTARFSAPMVPLGDPRPAGEVFEINCPEAGTARWIDGREWAYDFARDLPAGVRCTFRLRADVTTLDGIALGGRHEFAFSTGGPAVQDSSLPRPGAEWIDEEQAFLLVLDAAPDEASVLAHTHFAIEGVQSRVGARIVAGKDREAILASRGKNLPPGPIVILQARQRFPNGARVTLVWGKGVATASGVATTEDQRLEFRVRRAFEVQFTCERERKDADCLPVASLRVTFSAPVPWNQASRLALVGAGGQRWAPQARDTREPLHWEVSFHAPFPERANLRVEMPADLVDDAGRRAVNAARFPLTVKTASFPPLAKFAARFGILERADPVLPVTLRRLEPRVKVALLRADHQSKGGVADLLESVKATVFRVPPEASGEILPWLRRVAEAKRESSIFGTAPAGVGKSELPKPGGADAFEVVGLPLGRPGLYVVELESARLGQSLLEKPGPMYVPTAALVTNLGVHFKWGAENALVWVTALDHGRPVGGAKLTIQDCEGTVHWRGATDGQGLGRVTGLPPKAAVKTCPDVTAGSDWEQSRALQGVHDGLLVIAQTHDDLGLVHSSWDDGIQPWRFNLPVADERGPLRVHTILDRPLFRAGETVHMKHVIRRPSLAGFEAVPEAARPRRVILQHVGSDEKYELPLAWGLAGAAETVWTIPAGAKLGSYSITLAGPPLQRARWMRDEAAAEVFHPSGTFRVEEFRLPTLRATLRPPSEPLVDASEVALDVAVSYLAGGGARRLPVTLRAQLQPHAFVPFEGFENFVFANGAVTEGVTRRTRGEDEDDDEATDEAPAARGKPAVHQRESLTLDDQGTGKATVRRLPRAPVPRDLLVELEYRDPAGETQTAARRLTLWPATRLVGLVPEGGEVFGETLKAQVAVIDLAGRPVAGVPVAVDAFERRLYSHRKRLVGGFYAYEHVQEVRRLGELCRGTTSAGGMLVCEGKAPARGSLILQATARDERGRATVANADVWVVDPEAAWWFDVREHDRMDVLPERRRWEPGEKARLQVRMPFREAQALVTTEREGVLDARVVALSGSQPVIELPVLDTYAPNVFVSVLAVRGRVGGIQPTALVDLGRPAFKLGITELRVGWRAHELKVTVTPERESYRVRERARVRVRALTADGKPPAPGSEVALAAVDEALLELAANPSWDLLPAMLARRGHALTTATAQLHVVGKRHFGLKALPAGGGGGRQTTRELFDTLLYWNARVALDERGEATVEIPLNDSLTSFRVVAVATSGTAGFGTGAANIRTTQDLMLLAGLPPVVRHGDRFVAEVTLRNATTRAMEVVARARVQGLTTALEPRAATLAAGDSRALTWEVTVPPGAAALAWEIEAGERGGATDRLRLSQKVVSPVPVRTYQATLFQAEAGRVHREAVERPADSLAGQGGVRVMLAPTLVTGIDPVREWMARYPYTCLEQEVSRAVALRDPARWRALVERLPAHVDGEGLLKYFPSSREGSDVLTAYVSAVAHEAGVNLPAEIEKRLDEGLVKFVEGKVRRGSDLARPDLTLRKLAALEALARRGHADAKLVSTIAVEPNLWPTSGVLDWWSVLRRVYDVPQRAARLAEAERIVRARLNVQGSTIGFSTDASDRLWWLMVSNDVNAVRLVLTLLEAGVWRDEIPRLMRGALERRQHGAWDLTVANAWGTLAVDRFAREFERTPVTGVTSATLANDRRSVEWVSAPRGRALAFPWPAAADEVAIAHEGAGRPWVTVETRAAIPLRAPVSSGFQVTRTVTAVERRDPRRWSRGDIVRVKLEVDAQADMTWVVLDDPIPAGASHLGRGLGGESAIAAGGERGGGAAWPAFQERTFEAFRAYYRYVPKGALTVEYTIRLNQAGRFTLPATRVEALYAPEMFGELPNAVLEVAP
jgi:alpha-2-macroglobulin